MLAGALGSASSQCLLSYIGFGTTLFGAHLLEMAARWLVAFQSRDYVLATGEDPATETRAVQKVFKKRPEKRRLRRWRTKTPGREQQENRERGGKV